MSLRTAEMVMVVRIGTMSPLGAFVRITLRAKQVGRRLFSLGPLTHRTDERGMILNDAVATSVLSAVYQAAGGRTGRPVRFIDVESYTSLDPGAVHGAIAELIDAGLLMPGSTNDRICLNAAGAACVR